MEWYIFWDQIVLKMICSDRCTRYWKCCSSWVVSIDLIDGQHLDEWVRITPGGRKCWNITLQDDDIFQLLDRNTHEYFNLQIAFYSTSESSIRYYYTQLNIVEDERGKMHNVKQFCKDCVIIHMKYIKNGSLLTLTANQFCKSLLIASVVKTLHPKTMVCKICMNNFCTTSSYMQSSLTVVIMDNDRGKIYKLWKKQWMSSLSGAIDFEL